MRLSPSNFLLPTVAAAAVLLLAFPSVAPSQTSRTPSLEQRLTLGLQVRLPSEKQFVTAVVDAVQQGKVSQRLVDNTFFWARQRTPQSGNRFTRRPIIYFQPALEIQLARLGVDIATPRLSFFSRRF